MSSIARAILLPLTELAVLLPLLMLWVLLLLGLWGGIVGIFLLLLTLPAVFRYQAFVLESCAKGETPGAFDAEFFSWAGSAWTMFPLLLAVLVGLAGHFAARAWGDAGSWLVTFVAAAAVPASLAVLAITHAPLQALNPDAIVRVYTQTGARFLIAPAYSLLVPCLLLAIDLPGPLDVFAWLFLVFSSASLIGALIAPARLVDDVYIPDPIEPDAAAIVGSIEKAREAVFAHAYAFISRDNRAGGFRHLFAGIDKDPDPAAAWAWYFARMMQWEDKVPALFFGQHYVHDALRHGEEATALKVATRCRFADPGFRPLPGDRAALLAAAERSGNSELAEVLKMG